MKGLRVADGARPSNPAHNGIPKAHVRVGSLKAGNDPCDSAPRANRFHNAMTRATMAPRIKPRAFVVTVATAAVGITTACLRPPELPSESRPATDKPTTAASVAAAPSLKFVDTRLSQTQNATLSLSIDANKSVRTIQKRRFLGTNIAIWNQSSTFRDPEVHKYFKDAGIGLIRIPGGSASDQYFWNGNGVLNGTRIDRSKYHDGTWKIDYSKWAPGFMGFFGFPKDPMKTELSDWQGNSNVKDQLDFVKSLGAETLITVNAGTGTPRDAAEWVKWANHTNGYGVKFWEVGNELGGSWEAGTVLADGKTMDSAIYGAIYRDFSKAIKAADPKALVGSQGGVEFIKGALAHKDAPVDFVTYHDYFSSDAISPVALFQTLDKIKPAIKEVRDAVQKLRPGKNILIGMTEFNAQLFEGAQTSDVNSGLWLTAALLEMMYGGLDFATQWDSFTQKPDKGGGHGFMVEQGALPKAEYWTYVILNRYLGDKLLKIEVTSKDVRGYASRDETGAIYAIAVNTSQKDGYDLDFRIAGVEVAPIADCARFSQREYFWDAKGFTTPWNSGPTEMRLPVHGASIPVLPASLIACKFTPTKYEASMTVLGPTSLNLVNGGRAPLQVLLLKKDGQPASGVKVSAQGSQGFKVEPTEAQVDAKGLAYFEFAASSESMAGQIQLSSAGVTSTIFPVSSVEPEIVLRGSTKAPIQESVPILAAVRSKKGSRYALVESFNHIASVEAPGVNPTQINLNDGLASFAVSSAQANRLGLTFKAAELVGHFDIDFYERTTSEKLVYQFDDASSLAHATGKLSYRINPNIRPNEGVLEIALNDAQGWTQDVVDFEKLNEIKDLDRAGIEAVSFDLAVSDTFASGNQFAEFVMVLQSEANYWMPLEKIDLNGLAKGQFKRVTLTIKPDFQKAMKAFFKIVLIVNSGAKVSGSIYMNDLSFQIQGTK